MKTRQSGFSLIELLVTLTIASILLSYGVPNLKNLLVSQSMTTKANDMLVDFAFARSEAINTGRPVSIIANDSWEKGWQIVIDNDNDGVNEVLRVSNAIENQMILSDENVEKPIIFNPSGTLKSSVSRKIVMKHTAIAMQKELIVALSGNAQIY